MLNVDILKFRLVRLDTCKSTVSSAPAVTLQRK